MNTTTIIGSRRASGLIFAGRTSEPVELRSGTYVGSTDIYRIPFMLGHKHLTNPHMCVIGTTGSGKSYFIKSLLSRSSLHQDFSSILIDWNGEYDDVIKFVSGKIIRPSKDLAEINNLFPQRGGIISVNLQRLPNDNTRRHASHLVLDQLAGIMHSLRPDGSANLTVIIDEAWRMLDGTYNIGSLFREARKYGFRIIVATQLLSDLGPEILFNAATIIVFRTSSPSDIKTLLNMGIITDKDAEKLRELPVGKCMIYLSESDAGGSTKRFFVKKISGMSVKKFILKAKHMKKYIEHARALSVLEEIGVTKQVILKISEVLDQITDEIELDTLVSKLVSTGLKRDETVAFLRMLGIADLDIVTAYELAINRYDMHASESQG